MVYNISRFIFGHLVKHRLSDYKTRWPKIKKKGF